MTKTPTSSSELLECPKAPEFKLTPHNFKVCDNMGGSAFRHWTMLMKHKGIFIGFDNHEYVEYASSDPDAKWGLGCQDARSYGNPNPQSDTAKLISIGALPKEAQTLALQWVKEAIEIAKAKILKAEAAKEAADKAEKERREKEYQEKIANPWLSKVANG